MPFIRGLRHHLGQTQEEFARTVVVTVSTINRWENGRTVPSQLACRALNAVAERVGYPERLR